MKKNRHIVRLVQPGSIAEELEIEAGDELLRINGQKIEDVFDYQYLLQDEYVEILLRKASGEEWELEVEKDEMEDLGIEFENNLMGEYQSCSNNCIFCFIDQMPPGMRETLYFKDDDSRLSFLQGNYVTLTNMKMADIDRLIKYHLSPINISFQTTNPELRCMMLHNRFAGDILEKTKKLAEAGITINGQVVLCKNINDGEELNRTISDLVPFIPSIESVSVVPVGLSKYRDGLYPLEPFNKEDAEKVIDLVEGWQKKLFEEHGSHFVHVSDEWYLLAEREIPEADRYDGYIQLENGVGMLRLLKEEVEEALETRSGDDEERSISIATGRLAGPWIQSLLDLISKKYPKLKTEVYEIRNDFFGENITVSGLITGQDLIKQLKGKELGERLLLPCNMLRSGESVFLDDVTVDQLEEELQIRIQVVDTTGADFCEAVLDRNRQTNHRRRQMYEQTDSSSSWQT
ncbi:MAG: DUF512 domain-containing protein [Lachnospiraceae bacterium]|nr:DUF512 domain-containing protein [Lachnospiraceae bacterium]